MKQRSDRFLIWAIAISLALHAIFLVAFRYKQPVEAKEAPPQNVSITNIVRTPPPPTPTPKPVVVKQQPAAQQPTSHQPKMSVTKTISERGPAEPPVAPGPVSTTGPDVGIGDGASPGPSATPTVAPKPSCAKPDVEAAAVDVVEPEVPDTEVGVDATAQVRVTLSAAGAVLGTDIFKSTGDMRLDNAAQRAARQSRYSAEIRDCVAVGGSYLFTVDFRQ